MAKVEAVVKLFSTVAFVLQLASSSVLLDKTSSNLSSFKITELETNNNWTIIDLSHNAISSINFTNLLKRQNNLETLRLNFNPDFGKRENEPIFESKSLNNFECSGCGFTDIQSLYFTELSNLKELRLNRNRITDIKKDAFRMNSALKVLDLAENRLQVLPETLFDTLEHFEVLILTMNPIKSPENKALFKSQTLKRLRLDDCKMQAIYAETFSKLRELEAINLNRNEIKSLSVDAFKLTTNLKSLLIESNRLSSFPSGNHILNDLPLMELCIDGNPFELSTEFYKFVQRYANKTLRTNECNNNFSTSIEFLTVTEKPDDIITTITTSTDTSTQPQNSTNDATKGISDFFIGSYITVFLIVQAGAFVLLTLYLIKITKYEKLDGDVNYANTILNDDEIYRAYKLNQ